MLFFDNFSFVYCGWEYPVRQLAYCISILVTFDIMLYSVFIQRNIVQKDNFHMFELFSYFVSQVRIIINANNLDKLSYWIGSLVYLCEHFCIFNQKITFNNSTLEVIVHLGNVIAYVHVQLLHRFFVKTINIARQIHVTS